MGAALSVGRWTQLLFVFLTKGVRKLLRSHCNNWQTCYLWVTGSWPFYYIKCVEYLYIEESPVILLLFIAHLGLGITLKWWLVCTWTFPPLSQNGSPATHIFRAHDRTWLLKIFSSIYNIYMYVLFVHGVFFFVFPFPCPEVAYAVDRAFNPSSHFSF